MSNIIEFLKSQEAKEKLMSLYNLDEQAVDTNKAIPIVVSLISTNSGAPTSSVVYTALCNATTGQIYNKTYVFTMDLMLTPNTILAVTTGAFTEGAQVLKGCWVALTLEDE